MCPCPFCASIAILLCPLLLFKKTRKWLKNKIKRHHSSCERCQQSEHQQHIKDHTPCHCNACQAQKKITKSKSHTRRRK